MCSTIVKNTLKQHKLLYNAINPFVISFAAVLNGNCIFNHEDGAREKTPTVQHLNYLWSMLSRDIRKCCGCVCEKEQIKCKL